MNKRQFVKGMIVFFAAGPDLAALARSAYAKNPAVAAGAGEGVDMGLGDYDPGAHWYGMGIEIDKCIGCNRCVEACKAENGVPDEPFYFRTWIERYSILADGETKVECVSVKKATEEAPADPPAERQDVLRSFFVPKLCNHCANPPCVQVCPVGATFATRDGVVIVDEQRCIGCRYCIQACPYGARYLNPRTKTADKCTFCYHRVVKGLLPACVEVCPTQARVFGDLRSKASRLVRLQRMEKISVLKPDLNTKPKVYYTRLDGEVQ